MKNYIQNTYPVKQQGAALAVGLILLLIITLMGYTGMKGTILQEKMAAGLHNRTLANGGANSALRAGEDFLYGMIANTNGVVVEGTPNGTFQGVFSYYAVAGDPTSGINPRVSDFMQSNFDSTDGTVVGFDFTAVTQTGAALSAQPQYLIYNFNAPMSAGGSGGGSGAGGTQEFGAGGSSSSGGGAGSGGDQQATYVVVGKSPSGDGNSIAMVDSLYTVVGSSNPSQ